MPTPSAVAGGDGGYGDGFLQALGGVHDRWSFSGLAVFDDC
jgi:hypothetical protein